MQRHDSKRESGRHTPFDTKWDSETPKIIKNACTFGFILWWNRSTTQSWPSAIHALLKSTPTAWTPSNTTVGKAG